MVRDDSAPTDLPNPAVFALNGSAGAIPGPIVEEMETEHFPENPAFLRLTPEEKIRLTEAAELWEAPEGAFVHHPGDPGEDMLLVLEGRLESGGADGSVQRWFPGDLWGASHPSRPEPGGPALEAAERSKWLRWSGPVFHAFLESEPGIRKALAPLRNDEGLLVSGLPALPGGPGGSQRRRFRPSLKPALIGLVVLVAVGILLSWAVVRSDGMPPQIPLAAPAAYAGWLLFFLVGRALTEYSMDADSIVSRRFDWGRFSVVSRHVPMDSVQGVEIERNGWARRLLGYGNVIIKTSAMEGELRLADVNAPEEIAEDLRESRRSAVERNAGRDRMEMRRMLEASGVSDSAPRMIRGASSSAAVSVAGADTRIRKSPFVLVARLLSPLLATAAVLLAAGYAGTLMEVDRRFTAAAALIPVVWALYRFEDWRNDSFRITGGYVMDLYRKPLGLKESRRQVDLASVQNIRTEQKGLASFLFRYGNVVLVTAGGAADTVLADVARPWRIQELLFRRREQELRRRSESDRSRAKDDLARFAEALDQIRTHGPLEP